MSGQYMIKLAFLDVDGVLNCESMYTDGDEIISVKGGEISRRCMNVLNNFIEVTDTKIVVSSTWRSDIDIEDKLYGAGLKGEIIGKTPHLDRRITVRGNEIYKWLADNEEAIGRCHRDFHSYVIFDDDSDMLLWQRDNFFQTDAYSGLTHNVTWKAQRFLARFN